ncbi:hypothetical protein EMIHUDRAFT_245546 [Emiliania huxleyi CCMP1516]|uniref:Adaptor protein ClpS core domain-containing protein n=2 Tax=Emiliania huxleyi TaxID=2903 RepID=A0A0D3IX44_EMIH1|nr:hypothetical protein EMIHUDRAFT_103368 [Emiliania huxleyi CCMP1516]XP_005768258.1 hypothetical protein EMIHUDRAFT_245546 [Emiliania huxleyi CCMP1516]EOD15408.1 hypothetical protein EMIHUDRAFT_103368 [Emiliania huxleyi CCMP1516]EOD15829.1 hypothetical protein EMIHUDRAFT_245546 [Emiliania huxleyi CCMP1516]|eukprot:XP_005767837.1 hypothetical protein EMIHUDRAFT_103368 [Emiliania huxleyi CCMP1516]
MRGTIWTALVLLLSGVDALRVGVAPLCGAQRAAAATMQLAPAPAKTKTRQVTDGGGSGKGGSGPAAIVAKPKLMKNTEEVPMHKVILLGDEDYEEEPVCEALVRVIPDLKGEAKEKYLEAQKTGKSLLIVVPFETGEFYQEQLAREDPMIFAELEQE